MGGAPLGAGGHEPPLSEAKGTGGHTDALRFWITTKLTLIKTKIITETNSIIVSQLQSKHTNYNRLT